MKLSQLEYPQQNKYTIPYLPHVFYAVSFSFLCFIIPLNVALVGSDIVSTLRPDPTLVVDPWWMPTFWPNFLRFRNMLQICHPVSITDDMLLRTNSSVPIFSYVLRHGSAAESDSDDPTSRIYPAPYMGNPLSNCQVKTITLKIEIPTTASTYSTTIRCEVGGKKDFSFRIPDNITLSTIFKRTENADLGPDDMVDYLEVNVKPDAASIRVAGPALRALPANISSPNNVLGVLDAMQADLFSALWVQMTIWDEVAKKMRPTTLVAEWTAGSLCRANPLVNGPLNTTCDGDTDVRRIVRWYGVDGAYKEGSAFIAPFNTTLINVFIAIRDSVILDLGNANNLSNIYLSKSYFDSVIRPDPFFSWAEPVVTNLTIDGEPITTDYFWTFCTWGWGCVNTMSWAEALISAPENSSVNSLVLPYRPANPQARAALRFMYLCPTFQRKPIGSLFTSVFVATTSMLSVMYTIFSIVMPKFERQYQKNKQSLGRILNENNVECQEEHPLVAEGPTYAYPHLPYDSDTKYDEYPYSPSLNNEAPDPVENHKDLY